MAKASKKPAKVVDVKPAATDREAKVEAANKMYQNFEPDTSKSQMIREMFAAGHEKAIIADVMDIKYQHVRNVLITPLKRPVADKLA